MAAAPPSPKVEFDNAIKEKLLATVGAEVKKPATKVTIVGVGQVGMACSLSLLLQHLTTDLILMDVLEDKLKGELLDLKHGKLFLSNVNIDGGTEYKKTEHSKIVIITAGARQTVGESRLNLVQRNVNIFKFIIPSVVQFSPDAIIIVVSNPVDIMTYVTWKLSGLPRHRVIGTGTNLDSARFRHMISDHLGVSPTSVHGMIIGEHGDSSVPLWSEVSVGGRNLSSIDPKIGKRDGPKGWDKIHHKVITGANEVIKLKGYTNWAIGLSCGELVAAILKNKRSVHPISCFAKGQLGIQHDVCLSLPCVLSSSGVCNIVQLGLKPEEKAALLKSAEQIGAVQKDLKW